MPPGAARSSSPRRGCDGPSGHALAGVGREPAPQQAVDRVGVEPRRRRLPRAAVAGDRAVPPAEVVARGRGQSGLVGVRAQHGRGAEHVRGRVGAQRGRVQPGEGGRLVEGALSRVVHQVHEPVAAGRARRPGVHVQPRLGVPERHEQVAGHVVPRGGGVEGDGQRTGRRSDRRGGRRRAGRRRGGQRGDQGERAAQHESDPTEDGCCCYGHCHSFPRPAARAADRPTVALVSTSR